MEREPDVELKVVCGRRKSGSSASPRSRSDAYADSPAIAESQSERENLPDEVEPGVTYRDFAVRWRVAARLTEPDWEEAIRADRRTRRLPRNAPPREL